MNVWLTEPIFRNASGVLFLKHKYESKVKDCGHSRAKIH